MNILVVSPCGFHLGYVGCYGNAWVETPTLDALAAEGVIFDNHYSDCPNFEGAWRAWRTGHFNFHQSDVPPVFLPPGSTDMLSVLQSQRIPAWWVTDLPAAHQPDIRPNSELITLVQGKGLLGTQGNKVIDIVNKLEASDHRLIWVQPNFLIPPWSLDESTSEYFSRDCDQESDDQIEPLLNPKLGLLDADDELTFVRLQRTYAAAVTRFDRELAEIFNQLRRCNLFDSLMIMVTTDQGFPLGEHGLIGGSLPWLHEELVHIPLIIRLPDGEAAGLRIAALTHPVDLMPTVIEAFGLAAQNTHGSSVLPLIKGQRERIRDYACSGLKSGGAVEWSLRTRDWAFLLPDVVGENNPPRERQLYVKHDDRWEVNNVLQHNLELAESLEQTLRSFIRAPTAEAQGLQSLGLG